MSTKLLQENCPTRLSSSDAHSCQSHLQILKCVQINKNNQTMEESFKKEQWRPKANNVEETDQARRKLEKESFISSARQYAIKEEQNPIKKEHQEEKKFLQSKNVTNETFNKGINEKIEEIFEKVKQKKELEKKKPYPTASVSYPNQSLRKREQKKQTKNKSRKVPDTERLECTD